MMVERYLLGCLALAVVACSDDGGGEVGTAGTGGSSGVATAAGSSGTPGASSDSPTTTNDSEDGEDGDDDDSDGGSSTGGDGPIDPTAGACGEAPERMIIFGDSLYACFGQPGEKNGMGCSARLGHEYLEETYAAGVTYENEAVSGAVTSDVVSSQMPGTTVGQPGHALVVIWVGGNDISGLLLSSDADAEATYRDQLAPSLDMLWAQMFAWVDDPANFPDGATLIVNTQFNPFDDCTADPYGFMSPLKTSLLAEYNARIEERVAEREDTYIADQYPAFLGHGHHFGTAECPNYDADNAYWMIGGSDLVHPNTLGHVTIAGTLQGTIDQIYACD